MEFLKNILGDELYATVSEKINAYNGNEANKDKQVKLGNLASGEYVGKGKYDALEALIGGKDKELETANGLIAELKKSTKDNEGIQQKITDYDQQVKTLQAELERTKLDSAIKVALLEAHVNDIDYVTYKLHEKGDKIELDDNGHIKGWDDMLAGLKTALPNQFENSTEKKVIENKLSTRDTGGDGMTMADFVKKPYAERAAFVQDHPEEFNAMMNK